MEQLLGTQLYRILGLHWFPLMFLLIFMGCHKDQSLDLYFSSSGLKKCIFLSFADDLNILVSGGYAHNLSKMNSVAFFSPVCVWCQCQCLAGANPVLPKNWFSFHHQGAKLEQHYCITVNCHFSASPQIYRVWATLLTVQ